MKHEDIIKNVKLNGFCKINNFLDDIDLNFLDKISKIYKCKKGNNFGKFAISNRSLLIKLIKFDLKKIYYSYVLRKISKKYEFKKLSNQILDTETDLTNIDTYFNDISLKPVLDWHCDLSNKSMVKKGKITNPDMVSIKFFFYLNDVYSENGCLSYIPGSHKIVKELGKLIFNKDIDYDYYWSLKALTDFVKKNHVRKKLEKNLTNNQVEDFLKKSDSILIENKNNLFDLSMKKGGLIIFDEYGVHRGSQIKYNPRKVLRFFYRKRNINEKFRYN